MFNPEVAGVAKRRLAGVDTAVFYGSGNQFLDVHIDSFCPNSQYKDDRHNFEVWSSPYASASCGPSDPSCLQVCTRCGYFRLRQIGITKRRGFFSWWKK